MTRILRCRQSAFTLVEIAVVLVILAMLVGAVFTTQNMVHNAKLNTMMSEARYYIDAFGQFRQKYQFPPGDFPRASNTWPGAFNGDGNTLIRAGTTNEDEQYYPFHHMALAGLIDGSFNPALGYAAGRGIPRSAFGENVPLTFNHSDDVSGATLASRGYWNGLYRHTLHIGGGWHTPLGLVPSPFLAPADARAVDEKFDDSRPGIGLVTTFDPAFHRNCATNVAVEISEYIVTERGNTCALVIKVP